MNQKQGSGEAAITASKIISRSKESTVQNKHTLYFFASLGLLRKSKRQGWSKSYSHRITQYTGPGHTHMLTVIEAVYVQPCMNTYLHIQC